METTPFKERNESPAPSTTSKPSRYTRFKDYMTCLKLKRDVIIAFILFILIVCELLHNIIQGNSLDLSLKKISDTVYKSLSYYKNNTI